LRACTRMDAGKRSLECVGLVARPVFKTGLRP
jgi:hypothetical protein